MQESKTPCLISHPIGHGTSNAKVVTPKMYPDLNGCVAALYVCRFFPRLTLVTYGRFLHSGSGPAFEATRVVQACLGIALHFPTFSGYSY